jgi:hypothetical protein
LPRNERGIHFAEPLPRNETRVSHADTETRQRFTDDAIEMGPGGTIYTPDIIKIGPDIQKLIVGNSKRHVQTESMKIA